MDRRGTPGREPSRIDRKSLRHVLYGNNPRSLTRRLQAKLVHERTASRRKRHALGRARPHFPRPTAAPEGAWKTSSKMGGEWAGEASRRSAAEPGWVVVVRSSACCQAAGSRVTL